MTYALYGDEERRLLAETIRLEPDFLPGHLFLAGNHLRAGGSYPEAIDLVHQALERQPQGSDLVLAYYLLADLYNCTGDQQRSTEFAARGRQAEAADRAEREG